MELWQYYRILRKRKWLIIIGTLLCTLLAGGYVWLAPSTYTATATVMQRLPDGDKVTIFNGPMYQSDPRVLLSNLMNIAISRSVSEDALRRLRGQAVHTKGDPVAIIRSLDVQPIQDSMVLSLSVKASNPSDAVDGANCVAQALIEKYNVVNYGGASRIRQFIERQLPVEKSRLLKARDILRKYKEESNSVSLNTQTAAMIEQMTHVETNLAQYQVQERESEAKVSSIKSQLNRYPTSRLTATTIQSNPVWQQLQVELAKQEIELQKQLKDRTPNHPDVQALQQQIEETKRKLQSVGANITGSSTESVNPISDNLLQNYIAAMSEYSSAKAAVRAAEKVLADMKPAFATLPGREATLATLTAEEDAARNTYSLLKQKYDEAMIREKESSTVSALQVVDNAALELPTEWYKKVLKTFLFFLFGLIFTSGMAFLLNYLDNTIKTPAEAQSLLKLPVFSVVPTVKIHSLADRKALPTLGTSYEMLTANLWAMIDELEMRTFLIASAEPNMGRSQTAANLAITLASDGAKVIVVDADLRQPSLHEIFGIENERGLSSVLAGHLPLKRALKISTVPDLRVLPSGPPPANPIRVLRSKEMAQIVQDLNGMADFVIFDSP
ncbi:MAG TPA: Wzz/FepE/Etk N-terminal domain-containing protein, partial [Armatimonadota bacterium]